MFIDSFIKRFKDNYPNEIEYAFLNGNCYHFALILKNLFPSGKIKFDGGHFVFLFNDRFFDITGEVTSNYKNIKLKNWETLKEEDPLHYQSIERDCVYKAEIII